MYTLDSQFEYQMRKIIETIRKKNNNPNTIKVYAKIST